MFTKEIDIKVHFTAAMHKSCHLVIYADYQFSSYQFRFGIFIFQITGTLLEKWNTIIKKINK